MPFIMTMPKLSPTMEEGTITKWCKKEGDFVKAGEVLFEVATDKATVEHTALDEGYLRKILTKEGKEAKVNQPIAIFSETKDDDIQDYLPKEIPKEKVQKEKEPKAPEAPTESSSPVSQPSRKFLFVPEEPLEKMEFSEEEGGDVLASPLARSIAKEKGLDLTSLKGTGPGGRITSRDLPLAQPDLPVRFGKRARPQVKAGSYQEETMTPMRKTIGERLQAAKNTIPHFYVTQDIDATSLARVREELASHGLKVTFNDFVVKATALALKAHPEINRGYHEKNQTVVRYQSIDISIAVTINGGLITPIVRYADFKNLGQLSLEIKHLADLAKRSKLKPEQYKGGSFTISNLGMFGVRGFIPIINPPQGAILGVGALRDIPVLKDNAFVPGKGLELNLACDHRIIDGTDAAKFLKTLQKFLENPSVLLL